MVLIFSGKGWYKYEKPGGRTPYVDPEVTRIIEDHCRSLGIERRNIGSQVRINSRNIGINTNTCTTNFI